MNRIAIVEDDRVILDIMREAFESFGFMVLAAESGEEALDKLDGSTRVLFVDLNLTGMSGVELCRRLRQDSSPRIIYAVTGYASAIDLDECKEVGFDDFFTKPVRLDTLHLAVRQGFERLSSTS